MPPRDPELDKVTAAFIEARARFVVVGGFAVIAHRHVRATEDVDLLIPDDASNDSCCLAALRALRATRFSDGVPARAEMLAGQAHLRVLTDGGLVDLIREGEPPLDFESIERDALRADLGAGEFLVAGLRAIVAMKRLSGRPRDLGDLAELEAEHGELPIDPLPGLDDE